MARVVTAVLLLMATASVGWTQTPAQPKKPAPSTAAAQPQPPAKPKSPCPDAPYQTACDSYAELVKAHDDGVTADVGRGGVAFVCFRAQQDSFFLLTLRGPILWDKMGTDNAKGTYGPTYDALSKSYGFVTEFVNGIAANQTMPLRSFSGVWSFPDDPVFDARKVNLGDADDKSSVSVNSQQISGIARYKNRLDKSIDYQLVIQRSTGRYSERYTDQDAQTPFLEQQGRCVVPAK